MASKDAPTPNSDHSPLALPPQSTPAPTGGEDVDVDAGTQTTDLYWTSVTDTLMLQKTLHEENRSFRQRIEVLEDENRRLNRTIQDQGQTIRELNRRIDDLTQGIQSLQDQLQGQGQAQVQPQAQAQAQAQAQTQAQTQIQTHLQSEAQSPARVKWPWVGVKQKLIKKHEGPGPAPGPDPAGADGGFCLHRRWRTLMLFVLGLFFFAGAAVLPWATYGANEAVAGEEISKRKGIVMGVAGFVAIVVWLIAVVRTVE